MYSFSDIIPKNLHFCIYLFFLQAYQRPFYIYLRSSTTVKWFCLFYLYLIHEQRWVSKMYAPRDHFLKKISVFPPYSYLKGNICQTLNTVALHVRRNLNIPPFGGMGGVPWDIFVMVRVRVLEASLGVVLPGKSKKFECFRLSGLYNIFIFGMLYNTSNIKFQKPTNWNSKLFLCVVNVSWIAVKQYFAMARFMNFKRTTESKKKTFYSALTRL